MTPRNGTTFEKIFIQELEKLMALVSTSKYSIITSHIHPPIPTTQFDWCATWDGYYDGAPYGPAHPIGNGKTEFEAIADLIKSTPEDYL